MSILPDLLSGAIVTIELTVLSGALGILVSFGAGFGRLSPIFPIRAISGSFVEVFRGTSLFVQIYYFFFVLPVIGITLPAYPTAVLTLALNFGAYGAEVVRGTILSVDRGQREAALALGLTPRLTMQRIILPQAVSTMIAPFGNMMLELLKGTALVSLFAIHELTFAGTFAIAQQRGRLDVIYLSVLLIYLAMALPLMRGNRFVESRVRRALHLSYGPSRN